MDEGLQGGLLQRVSQRLWNSGGVITAKPLHCHENLTQGTITPLLRRAEFAEQIQAHYQGKTVISSYQSRFRGRTELGESIQRQPLAEISSPSSSWEGNISPETWNNSQPTREIAVSQGLMQVKPAQNPVISSTVLQKKDDLLAPSSTEMLNLPMTSNTGMEGLMRVKPAQNPVISSAILQKKDDLLAPSPTETLNLPMGSNTGMEGLMRVKPAQNPAISSTVLQKKDDLLAPSPTETLNLPMGSNTGMESLISVKPIQNTIISPTVSSPVLQKQSNSPPQAVKGEIMKTQETSFSQIKGTVAPTSDSLIQALPLEKTDLSRKITEITPRFNTSLPTPLVSPMVIQRQENNSSTSINTTTSSPPPPTPPTPNSEGDITQIAEQVSRLLSRRWQIERERRGGN